MKPVPASVLAKTLAAQRQGARAQATGRAFEDALEVACVFYRTHTLVGDRYLPVHRYPGTAPAAVIARGHPQTAGVPGRMVYVKRGAVDFVGCYLVKPDLPARPIAFDAKVVTGDASFLVAARDRHQLDFLLAFRAAGGLSFYLLYDSTLGLSWMCRQLDALAAGERVAVCSRRTVEGVSRVAHHSLPVLQPSTALDIASGRRPGIDVLRLVREMDAVEVER